MIITTPTSIATAMAAPVCAPSLQGGLLVPAGKQRVAVPAAAATKAYVCPQNGQLTDVVVDATFPGTRAWSPPI